MGMILTETACTLIFAVYDDGKHDSSRVTGMGLIYSCSDKTLKVLIIFYLVTFALSSVAHTLVSCTLLRLPVFGPPTYIQAKLTTYDNILC